MADEIKFHLIKAPDFKECIIDGVFGGLQPNGRLGMALYTQRTPIPTVQVNAVNADGSLGNELRERREVRDGIVRQVHMFVHMDYATARAIHKWIGEKLDEIDKLTKKNGV